MTHPGRVAREALDELGAALGKRLAAGEPVADEEFDALLSEKPRKKAGRYWSGVRASRSATRLLSRVGAQRILDVGAGVGKFCAIASLASSRRVWGLERRGQLVHDARLLAQRLGAEVVIREGTLASIDVADFDGFYFFNPFGEYLAKEDGRYDDEFPRTLEAYLDDARLVEGWLREAKVGTALVTYNGLGGRIPSCYEVRHSTLVRDEVMRLWVKTSPTVASTTAHLEVEYQLLSASKLASLSAADTEALYASNPLIAALARL
jgi:SAM-dependent methyltransferase